MSSADDKSAAPDDVDVDGGHATATRNDGVAFPFAGAHTDGDGDVDGDPRDAMALAVNVGADDDEADDRRDGDVELLPRRGGGAFSGSDGSGSGGTADPAAGLLAAADALRDPRAQRHRHRGLDGSPRRTAARDERAARTAAAVAVLTHQQQGGAVAGAAFVDDGGSAGSDDGRDGFHAVVNADRYRYVPRSGDTNDDDHVRGAPRTPLAAAQGSGAPPAADSGADSRANDGGDARASSGFGSRGSRAGNDDRYDGDDGGSGGSEYSNGFGNGPDPDTVDPAIVRQQRALTASGRRRSLSAVAAGDLTLAIDRPSAADYDDAEAQQDDGTYDRAAAALERGEVPPPPPLHGGPCRCWTCATLKRHPTRLLCAGGLVMVTAVLLGVAARLLLASPSVPPLWSRDQLNATYTAVRTRMRASAYAWNNVGWDSSSSGGTYFERMQRAGIDYDTYARPLQLALEAVATNGDATMGSLRWLTIAALVDPAAIGDADAAATAEGGTTPTKGASKLGGAPHLPIGWTDPPAGAGAGATFVAQVNLRDITVHDLRGTLPTRGMLYWYSNPPNASSASAPGQQQSVWWYDGDVATGLVQPVPDTCTPPRCVLLSRWAVAVSCNLPPWSDAVLKQCTDTARVPFLDWFDGTASDITSPSPAALFDVLTHVTTDDAQFVAAGMPSVPPPPDVAVASHARLFTLYADAGALGSTDEWHSAAYARWSDLLQGKVADAVTVTTHT